MFRKHHPTILLVLGLSILHRLHATLYTQHGTLSPYSATTIFDHVIQHDSPSPSSSSARLQQPYPSPLPAIATPNLPSNLQYLTSSSPAHHRHLASIYSPTSIPPLRQYSHPQRIEYQPGRGAQRAGHSFGGYTNGLFGLPPLTGHLESITDLTYIVDGRILKQYLVMENHDDDNSLDSFLNNPINRDAYVPFLPHLNFASNPRPNHGFPSGQYRSAPLRQPTYNVGSGSLGFVRHPNGAVYLGSGSLGYINDQQRSSALQDIRDRQTPGAGPLTFGQTPK